jgi:hypothetical protein
MTGAARLSIIRFRSRMKNSPSRGNDFYRNAMKEAPERLLMSAVGAKRQQQTPNFPSRGNDFHRNAMKEAPERLLIR